MKTGTVLATLFAIASFPLLAQQPSAANPSSSPATQQTTPPTAPPDQTTPPPAAQPDQAAPPSAAPGQPGSSTATPEASAAPVADLRPVTGELVSRLDSKTAKTGDDVVVQTKSAAKTADGTEIPKGSKLVGHVVAVQPSAGGQNSQVALKFDHAELAGGQNLPIQSEIQSIAPAASEAASSDAGAAAMNPPPAGGMPGGSAAGMPGAPSQSSPAATPTPGAEGTSAAGNGEPAAGTIVARNGKIAIRATSVPGVLLAINAPGEQDPRMAQASGILLGARKDVQLDGGTQVVIGVAATGAGTQ